MSTTHGPPAGVVSAPTRAARPSSARLTASTCRACPNVIERNVPTVDGAATRCPSTACIEPARSASTSSMQSPTRQRRVDHRQALVRRVRTGRDSLLQQLRQPQPLPERGRQQQTRIRDQRHVVRGHRDGAEIVRCSQQEGSLEFPEQSRRGNRDRARQQHPLSVATPSTGARTGGSRLRRPSDHSTGRPLVRRLHTLVSQHYRGGEQAVPGPRYQGQVCVRSRAPLSASRPTASSSTPETM